MYFASYQVLVHQSNQSKTRISLNKWLTSNRKHSELIPAYGRKVDKQTGHAYVNPAYMTTIVAGSAGSKEKISSGSAAAKYLAKYIEDYGLVQSVLVKDWKWSGGCGGIRREGRVVCARVCNSWRYMLLVEMFLYRTGYNLRIWKYP